VNTGLLFFHSTLALERQRNSCK